MSRLTGATPRPGKPAGLRLCHADALELLEIIDGCVRCKSEEDFQRLFWKLRGLLLFENACAVLGRCDDRRGVIVDHLVNVSGLEQFAPMARDYLQRSALSRDHFASYGLKFWSEARRRLGQPRELVSLAFDLGMRDGYTIGSRPMPGAPHGSMFCLSIPSACRDERTEALLERVVPHLHFAFCRLLDGHRSDAGGVVLSTVEKDILQLIMQGKSSWDMSVIIGISERTVNYHIYRAMEKLDAVNRPQAVAVALRLGLIEIG